MHATLTRDLTRYTQAANAARRLNETSPYDQAHKDAQHAENLAILRATALDHLDAIDLAAARAHLTQAHQQFVDALAEPQAVTLAWDAMGPLRDAGMGPLELTEEANTPAELAAVQIYGASIIRATGARPTLGERLARSDRPSPGVQVLNDAVLNRAQALNLDTAAVTEARDDLNAATAARGIWGALADRRIIGADALATFTNEPETLAAVRAAQQATTGADLTLEQGVAISLARQQGDHVPVTED